MTNALVTLNIGGCLCRNSRDSFKDACRRWDCDYLEITEARPGVHPHAMKLLSFDITGAERIFYVDADTVIRGDTPSPFQSFPENVFLAMNNQQSHMDPGSLRACSDTILRDFRAICDVYGEAPVNAEIFFNSGVWMATRLLHEAVLARAYEISIGMYGKTDWRDQSALNYALSSMRTTVLEGMPDWNYQSPPDTGPKGYMTAFVYHYAGDPEGRSKLLPVVNWYAKGATREELPTILRTIAARRGAEIGVQKGEHAELLLKEWGGFLYLVDCWKHQDSSIYPCMGNVSDDDHELFYMDAVDRLKAYASHSEIIRDYSTAAADKVPDGSLDFVYIDSNHTYDAVTADLRAWYPKVRPGGMIAGHDFTFDGNDDLPHGGTFGVRPAVFDFLADKPSVLYVAKAEEWPTWHFWKPVSAARAKRAKPRLLWIGDAVAHTGFARVTHAVCERLRQWWDLSVVGVNYFGDPHEYPYPIYPARLGGDMWGLGRFRDLLPELQPDAAICINDPWIAHRFTEFTAPVPFAAYMPVDAKNIPHQVCDALNALDLAIFYTQFGLDECRRNGYKGDAVVIPHGVDTGIYHPVPMATARQKLNLSKDIPADAFIVGNVNRNQPRKRLDLAIEYFAEWVHCYHLPEHVYLYLHCAQQDSGWDLAQLAYWYGIVGRLMLPPEDAITAQRGWPEDFMKNVYSAFDVQLSTAEGEGWGLPQIEGMACGIPQIVPQYSGLGEWAAGAAYMVPVTSHATHIGINTIGGIPDKTETIKALNHMYQNREERERYARLALERARDPRFDWDRIAQQFSIAIFDMMVRGNERREEYRNATAKGSDATAAA